MGVWDNGTMVMWDNGGIWDNDDMGQRISSSPDARRPQTRSGVNALAAHGSSGMVRFQ